MTIDNFSKYQIEWLTSHNDIEFNKEEEDLIIRFLRDTAELYQKENECEDCISRAEALEMLGDEPENWTDTEKEIQEVNDYRWFKSILENLPPVTPQQTGWIPCSERMPEVSDYYLIQYSRHICPDEMAVAYYSVEESECDENYTWEFKPFADCKEVIAWMPLPKPYKAESEEEE